MNGWCTTWTVCTTWYVASSVVHCITQRCTIVPCMPTPVHHARHTQAWPRQHAPAQSMFSMCHYVCRAACGGEQADKGRNAEGARRPESQAGEPERQSA
eukprot:364397-Chlamydomonas_euryale.AAC.27